MFPRLLIFLLFLFLPSSIFCSTCPNHVDGRKCKSNSDCSPNTKCFFGNDDPVGHGHCCAINERKYYNAMFQEMISDPLSRIPAELFSPVRGETCQNSRDCVFPEVCMVSRKLGDNTKIPSPIQIHEIKRIKKHCYNKFSHWTSNPNSYSVQFCNTNSECKNNNCLKLDGTVIEMKMTRVWNTHKIIIYHPLHFGKRSRTMRNARLEMEEIDEIDEKDTVWKLDLEDGRFYLWKDRDEHTLDHCSFSFRGHRVMANPKTPVRVRSASLICSELFEEYSEDLEIFGANVTIETKPIAYDGICGHPNLKCSKCFINNKLFTCTEDEECYKIGDQGWTNRNEKSYCSQKTYNGNRLCRRELFTCPPDSLNSDGTVPPSGECLEDKDCIGMANYTNLANVNEDYHPHCFNGVCCARRTLCNGSFEFPYALPLEANTLKVPKPCHRDEDCAMFYGTIGTCVFHKKVRELFEKREIKYLNSTSKTMKNSYGMCCYTKENVCVNGGIPSTDVYIKSNCTTQFDCNPQLPPYEWKAYCSVHQKERTCCKDEPKNLMCPDFFTPFRIEPECVDVDPDIEDSGRCMKEYDGKRTGMCYKGYCCPRLRIDHLKRATPSESNYLTEIPCDPSVPLDMFYQWAYCDAETERVLVLGSKQKNGKGLDWQTNRCLLDSDCGHERFLCVHKYYGLRFCVVNPEVCFLFLHF